MKYRLSILVIFLLLVFAAQVLAQGTSMDIYQDAMRLARAEKVTESVALLQKLVAEHPDDSLVDDALFQIGALSEKKLGDFKTASEAYARVLEQFPSSKNARRSKARLNFLTKSRETGDEPLRNMNHVLQNYHKIGSEKSIELMAALAKDFPKFNKRDQVLFWLAEEYNRGKDYDRALLNYYDVIQQYPTSKWAYFSTKSAGQVFVEKRDFDAATQLFNRLRNFESTIPGASMSADSLIENVNKFKRLRHLYWFCLLIILGNFAMFGLGTKWRQLGKKQLISIAVDLGIISVVFIVAMFYATTKAWIYSMNIGILWVAFSLATVGKQLYISTNSFSIPVKSVLIFVWFLMAVAITYVVYYHTDMLYLMFDSLQYELQRK